MIFAADGPPLRVMSVQNRLFERLSYDKVTNLEDSPGLHGLRRAARRAQRPGLTACHSALPPAVRQGAVPPGR
ncbi:hypothetical protein GCM10028783_00400 [Modestobacter muralis]